MKEERKNDLYFKISGFSQNEEERKIQLDELIKKRDALIAEREEKRRMDIENRNSNIKSGVLGFAIGDALGVPVEFKNRETLESNPVIDMMEYGSHRVPKGTWSDDTSLLMATMDSITNNGKIDYRDILSRFLNWMNKAEYTATDKVFDIGFTTSNSLKNYAFGVDPLKCGGNNINENGNGSLMRILPLAYYLYYVKYLEEVEVDIINKVSSLTHAHEISKMGCKIYVDYVKKLLETKDKFMAYEYIKNYDYSKFYSKETIKCYERILNGNLSELSENEISSSGYVVSTLEACLWCTLKENSYKDAVLSAVNLGDDTDTVGALTGGINGILYGEASIPIKWLEVLQKRNYIEDMCDSFNKSFDKQNSKNII